MCTGLGVAESAHAQACCAGTAAVTPGRLEIHEQALLGVELKAADVFGTFDPTGRYQSSPASFSELDLEQDLFGAVRFLDRGQASVLVPFLETRRTSLDLSAFGGGIGDLNVAGRYDFTLAGASRVVPGIAILAGITAPTGTPPDAAGAGPLAVSATGIGAYQFNGGLAVEQVFGPWLVNATAIISQRTARTVGPEGDQVHERLGAQYTWLAALAYAFPNDCALAFSASYLVEGDATIDGVDTLGTAHRLPTVTVSGLLPVEDTWRIQGGVSTVLPLSTLGLNQPATTGLFATIIRSWI